MSRPKLAHEYASEAFKLGDRQAFNHLPRPPHCDARILHHPIEGGCDYCAKATELQAERERLNVSNTGMANRQWPCPADQARSAKNYHAWPGNQPKTEKQINEEGEKFVEELRRLGVVIDHE